MTEQLSLFNHSEGAEEAPSIGVFAVEEDETGSWVVPVEEADDLVEEAEATEVTEADDLVFNTFVIRRKAYASGYNMARDGAKESDNPYGKPNGQRDSIELADFWKDGFVAFQLNVYNDKRDGYIIQDKRGVMMLKPTLDEKGNKLND